MSGIIISTRVRLARNLKDYPFPCKLSIQGRNKVSELVRTAIMQSNSALQNDFDYIKLGELSPTQSVSLVEKRLVSPEFISDTSGRALLLSKDNSLSIMINEEDHIRLQVIKKGTLLDENLEFAFDEKLGYLTQCPTNLGTGMRASVMLHLPALERSRAISRIAGSLSKLGLTIRGAHGEGTEPKGALYQLSNQVTLGISEKAAIENLKNIALQLASQEEQARERLCASIDVQDTVARSLGILRTALVISHDEALKLLSNVRMGVMSGQITDVSTDVIDSLMTEIEPATLSVTAGKQLSAHERDIERAKLIKSKI